MGFAEVYKYILSYFGIGFLGIGILLSVGLIIPACYWLFTSVSVNKGAVVFRRILLMLAIMYVSFSYLRAPSFYEIGGWWKTTFWATFVIGFIVPVFRLDIARPDRRKDRVIAWMSGVWWTLLIVSEALLVSGATLQAFILYLFIVVTGLLCGGMMGTTVAQTAKRKISESTEATGTK
ncbi:MAG: hypothetical protein JW925_10335 [Syntrophaceae bacterium]|nr:hypothetical protein [Syntrophaceae bacterium]